MQKLTELIREDMKPALGVTEPGSYRICRGKCEEIYGR